MSIVVFDDNLQEDGSTTLSGIQPETVTLRVNSVFNPTVGITLPSAVYRSATLSIYDNDHGPTGVNNSYTAQEGMTLIVDDADGLRTGAVTNDDSVLLNDTDPNLAASTTLTTDFLK